MPFFKLTLWVILAEFVEVGKLYLQQQQQEPSKYLYNWYNWTQDKNMTYLPFIDESYSMVLKSKHAFFSRDFKDVSEKMQ